MRSRPKAAAVIGSLAITATLLLAGCGGSSTAEAPSAAAWDPPRPTGIADDLWASMSEDPAATDPAVLAQACTDLAPMSASDIDGAISLSEGSTPEEWQAWGDYVLAYLTPLCASLPAGAAEESTEPSAEASAQAAATTGGVSADQAVLFVKVLCDFNSENGGTAVFDQAAGTCTGLGLGTDGDMISSEYIIENLNAYIMSRSFVCPDASDAEPSAECQVAFIESEVAAAE